MTEWESTIPQIETLEDINLAVRLAKERSLSAAEKHLIVQQAAKLGFEFDKAKGCYVEPIPFVPTRGVNLIAVGWRDGVLRVKFAGKDKDHCGRHLNVPEAEFDMLRNNGWPDRLYSKRIKSRYPYEREA